jgi:hypothetical protein
MDSNDGKECAMQKRQRDPETFLPLTPAVFQILLALIGGERHGYSIIQEVNSSSKGTFHLF